MHPFVQTRKSNLLAFKLNNVPWLTENQIETKDSSKTKFHYILFSIKSDRFFHFPVIKWNKIKKVSIVTLFYCKACFYPSKLYLSICIEVKV